MPRPADGPAAKIDNAEVLEPAAVPPPPSAASAVTGPFCREIYDHSAPKSGICPPDDAGE